MKDMIDLGPGDDLGLLVVMTRKQPGIAIGLCDAVGERDDLSLEEQADVAREVLQVIAGPDQSTAAELPSYNERIAFVFVQNRNGGWRGYFYVDNDLVVLPKTMRSAVARVMLSEKPRRLEAA